MKTHGIAKFEKVSYEQFKTDWMKVFGSDNADMTNEDLEANIQQCYENIKLPKRSTTGAAGYDFHIPFYTSLDAGEVQVIPTGIRCIMDNGWVLKCYPRSGHGFKRGIKLANTVGIIDEDYANADNEGHIHIKLVNESVLGGFIEFHASDKFCQGIFLPYGTTVDDDANGERTGGFGSTGA